MKVFTMNLYLGTDTKGQTIQNKIKKLAAERNISPSKFLKNCVDYYIYHQSEIKGK